MWNYAPNKTVAVVAVTGIENNAVAKDFNLNQNYPNPFNPSTIISYQIPVSGRVLLKVYDALGNEVATLIDREQSAGNHQIEFNTQQTTHCLPDRQATDNYRAEYISTAYPREVLRMLRR